MKDLKPNFTQIPNIFLDEYMSILSSSEFKILICISRKTYGFHKKTDYISISQFEKLTGMTKKTIIQSLKKLENIELIKVKKTENKTTSFSLNVDEKSSEKSKKGGVKITPPKDEKSDKSGVKIPPQWCKKYTKGGVKITHTKENNKIKYTKENNICSFLDDFENIFEKIWIEYNFKTNRKKAKDKLYVILKNSKHPEEKFKEILNGVKKYNSNREKLEKLKKWVPQKQQFVFWLNQERWQDEYGDVKTGPKYLEIKKGEYGEGGEAIEI